MNLGRLTHRGHMLSIHDVPHHILWKNHSAEADLEGIREHTKTFQVARRQEGPSMNTLILTHLARR